MKTIVRYSTYNGSVYRIIEEEHRGYAGSRIITNRMEKINEAPIQQDEIEYNKIVEKDIEERRRRKNSCDNDNREY